MLVVLKCIAIGVTYVAPFYLRHGLARNSPSTIKFRMATTTAASLVAWLPLYWTLQKQGKSPLLLHLLGLHWHGMLAAVLKSTALTACLFTGPILQSWLSQTHHASCQNRLQTLRNLIVAPLTEEFCFRACMAPLFLLEGCSRIRTVLITPVMFGVAHLHHLVELVKFQGLQPHVAVLQVSFQFLYTTVFGWYVTHVFLSTGHLASAIVIHAICNWQGFPPLADLKGHPHCRQLLLAYAAGIAIFVRQFSAWTMTSNHSSYWP